MSKKIKIIIASIIFIIVALIATNVSAFVPSRTPHLDTWTNRYELMPQGNVYCINRGGTLRFTPIVNTEPTTWAVTHVGVDYPNGDTVIEWKDYIGITKEQVKYGLTSALESRIEDTESGKMEPGREGVWRSYWNGKTYTCDTYEVGEFYNGKEILAVGKWIYAHTPTYTEGNTTNNNNDYVSYLFSAGDENTPTAFELKTGNYNTDTKSDEADSQLIQDAVWISDLNIGPTHPTTPEKAMELYEESLNYQDIASSLKEENYKFSTTTGDPQVIVNREQGTYIVGPYKLSYPSDTRFSYVQDIYIVDVNQNVIASISGTDENNNPCKKLTLITENNATYPANNQSFFIQFNASDIGDIKRLYLKADFAYLSESSSTYTELKGKGEIYQLVGLYEQEVETIYGKGHYETCNGSLSLTGYPYTQSICRYCGQGEKYCNVYPCTNINGHYIETKTIYPNKVCNKCGTQYDYNMTQCTNKYWVGTNAWDVRHRGIIEEAKIGEFSSQYLIEAEGTRKWSEVSRLAGITIPSEPEQTPEPIDLKIELGGIVWEDANGGKESLSNGKIDSGEVGIPHVEVALYQSNSGTPIATTTTDVNGRYSFKNLDAMKQYYVKFTYNGQYYQPTTYSDTSSWGTNSWEKNSNGADTKTERTDFNSRFENIGSYPESYNGLAGANETFTKQELINAGVIDNFGNLIGSGNSKMVQYVKDCMMNAYTGSGNGSYDLYPVKDVFVIDDNQARTRLIQRVDILYPYATQINLGLSQRQEADLAVKKDIQKVTLEINGQEHEYTYDTIEANTEGAWDINVRLSDFYYDTNYSRELYKSDYLYKVSDYGENYTDYGKSKEDELQVYVTYKIMIRNQSLSIQARVNELVDYFDSDYEYVDERSYIKVSGNTLNVNASTSSRYGQGTETNLDGYDKIYVKGLDGNYLSAGETAYVYLTFKVKKDTREDGEDWLRLDEELQSGNPIGVGKENIVEINGYLTRYAAGTQVPNVGDVGGKAAGIVDRDSKPGNLNPTDVPKDGDIAYENFEDDTDKAPNIRIKLYRDDESNRVISGVVWEDERNEEIGATTTGNGIREENETLINGVTVQLVELMENGTEFVWRTFEQGSGTADSTTPIINAYNLVSNYEFGEEHDGAYAFKSFAPGKYVVRFIYGDTERTVLTKDVDSDVNKTLQKTGLNEKSYNGQDFKSTTYQQGITQNRTYTWRNKSTWATGQETLGNILTQISTFKPDASNNETANAKLNELKAYLYDIVASDAANNVSDAKDIESRRNEVTNYSDDNAINHIAEVLASYRELPEYVGNKYNQTQIQSLIDELMQETKMEAETGVIVVEFEYDKTETDNQVVNNTASYKIQNLDLGLEERPKAQLEIEKEVTNVKLTLADGSILFDAKATASNVLWRDHKDYEVGYKGNLMDADKFSSLENIRKKNSSKFGLVQLSMDEELMHGATIEITYQVKVSNVGEVDYKDNLFYYTGNKSENAQVVTTSANQVIDYVANNLQFAQDKNSAWKVIENDELISQGLVNTALSSQVDKYNTILVTEALNADLVPSLYKSKVDKNAVDSVNVPLVLTQVITAENETDDLTYRNIVEIVKTSNTVGRKNEYSVVGNQDPTEEPQELDSDRAEVVRILPPFGNAGIYIMIAIITIAAIGIIILGIIFIKKKVLKK